MSRKYSLILLIAATLGSRSLAQNPSASSGTPADPSPPAFVPAADGGLGSTTTLDQQMHPARKQEELVKKAEIPRVMAAAAEPVPALKYQFWPRPQTLKSGSAQMHFFRAITLLLGQSAESRKQFERLSTVDTGELDITQVRSFVATQSSVLNELHEMAMCESFDLDHHIRNLKGIELYSYLLPDVQEARSLGRLLRLRAIEQIDRNDFEGAVSTISDGYRLSALVATGETLIEQLVAIAISSMMEETVERAIQKPGCPNLYWALASLPRPVSRIREAIQFEMHFLRRIIPLLDEGETGNYPEEVWRQKWVDSIEPLSELSGATGQEVTLALAMATIGLVEPARQRLLDSGFQMETLSTMPPTQIVVIDTSRELRRMSDDAVRAYLLPIDMRGPVLAGNDTKFRKWVQEERWTSGAAMIASFFFPAILQAQEAEVRKLMTQQRLMTVEAIRMHVATHGGQLPESLEVLSPVPAMRDPYTGKPFGYRIETLDDKLTIVLTSDVPATAQMYREFRFQIRP